MKNYVGNNVQTRILNIINANWKKNNIVFNNTVHKLTLC